MDIKCGPVTFKDQHVAILLKFVEPRTYDLQVVTDQRLTTVEDKLAEKLREGINSSLCAFLVEYGAEGKEGLK